MAWKCLETFLGIKLLRDGVGKEGSFHLHRSGCKNLYHLFYLVHVGSVDTERGGVNQCIAFYYFFNFNNQQLIQYYALSHYHYVIINSVIIIT